MKKGFCDSREELCIICEYHLGNQDRMEIPVIQTQGLVEYQHKIIVPGDI